MISKNEKKRFNLNFKIKKKNILQHGAILKYNKNFSPSLTNFTKSLVRIIRDRCARETKLVSYTFYFQLKWPKW